MNYFFNTWGTLIFFLQVFAGLFIAGALIFLIINLTDKLHLPEAANNIISTIIIVFSFAFSMFCMYLFNIYLNDGEIKELRIINKNGIPCLTVLFSAEYSGKVTSWYKKKLKKFNIETGKLLDQTILATRDYSDDDVIQRYHPAGWVFDKTKGTKAKTLRNRISSRTSQVTKPLLIAPRLVKELNKKAAANNRKVWAIHFSTYLGDYDTYVSFMGSNGQELNRINLSRMFKDKYATVLATLSQKNETLVFVTRRRYTLTALRTDPVTGKIRGRIEYFN